MSTTEVRDLSKVVLIFGTFVGQDDVLDLSDNTRYKFSPPSSDSDASWRGGLPGGSLRPPFLCLTIGEHLFDPQGWVFGSHADSDVCDVQLVKNNQTGVSNRLFRVDIDPRSYNPRMTALKDREIRISNGSNSAICKPGNPFIIDSPVVIDLGAVSFRAWFPKRTATEYSRYKTAALRISQDILHAAPKYVPSITNHQETAHDNVRCGRNGVVYLRSTVAESRGMNAAVFMVVDKATRKRFGAKEPYYKLSDNHAIARKRFEELSREYEYIIRLNHPHILKAYDLVLAEDVTLPPWMIIEYIPLNLRQVLPNLEMSDMPSVMAHLSSALHHMHVLGMAHRDVKPDNVLVQIRNGKRTIKLADFGTSKRTDGRTMDTFTGTEIYMAPELFKRPRCYTSKVDIWALGLIAMQLFTSFDPDTDSEWNPADFGPWMRDVILPLVEEAPAEVRPLLRGLLRKCPKRRWSARKSLRWLLEHTQATDDTHIKAQPPETGGSNSGRKRHASEMDEDDRRVKSPDPFHSTTKAQAGPSTDVVLDSGSPLGSASAPTPLPEDGQSDGVAGEAGDVSSDAGGTDTEDDWKEEDGQAEGIKWLHGTRGSI